MKCLTIWQPWAWAIINGHKIIENRRQSTSHRGPLLIHAGKKFDAEGADWLHLQMFCGKIPKIQFPLDYTMGAIVGAVILERCETIWNARLSGKPISPWFTGPWGWHMREPIVFDKPFPLRGRQRIFNVYEDDAPGLSKAWNAAREDNDER